MTEHTCHDMNPPFPGPCAACERERAAARITRFEVIDRSVGRICTYDACAVQLSYQDEGRTLKVFVERTEDR